jgi:hypothetical protein
MQKLLRTVIILLLLIVAAAIVYTEANIYAPQRPVVSGMKTPELPRAQTSPPQNKPLSATPPVASVMLGTEASPAVVKLVPAPEPEERIAERAEDRQIQRGIEHYAGRIAATALAENFLQLFQAIIYFLTLIIMYLLMESVRKFADSASKSAEAARKSAEIAQALVGNAPKPPASPKLPPHYYRKR